MKQQFCIKHSCNGFKNKQQNHKHNTSSMPSIHNSCHKMATRINSLLTNWACSTKTFQDIDSKTKSNQNIFCQLISQPTTKLFHTGECARKLFKRFMPAVFLEIVGDLEATVNAYTNACGCTWPMLINTSWTSWRIVACGVSIRAMIWWMDCICRM